MSAASFSCTLPAVAATQLLTINATVDELASSFEFSQTVTVTGGDGMEMEPTNNTLVTSYSSFSSSVAPSSSSGGATTPASSGGGGGGGGSSGLLLVLLATLKLLGALIRQARMIRSNGAVLCRLFFLGLFREATHKKANFEE